MSIAAVVRPLGRLHEVARYALSVLTLRARSIPSLPVSSDTWRASAYLYAATLTADLVSYDLPVPVALAIAGITVTAGVIWARRSSAAGRYVFLIFAASSVIQCADILTHSPWVSVAGLGLLLYGVWQIHTSDHDG